MAEIGLWCRQSHLVYPVVSEIPLLLEDEALPEAVVGVGEPPA